jgi:hypothetical protein
MKNRATILGLVPKQAPRPPGIGRKNERKEVEMKETEEGIWRARRDSNLRRSAGVSAAGARSRNPERSEGSLDDDSLKRMARPERFELPTYCSGGLAARRMNNLQRIVRNYDNVP